MGILETINSSADIKRLSADELPLLCEELRAFEINNIARSGGHLASNLGAVELTVALHRVYDTELDRIVFDVGHQSYTHKIITGRREAFPSLRQHGGLSGFPKPCESVNDAFIAGHASNSVSVALGMAKARSLTGGSYDVVAIIGDGALTGGLAYEGLSNAAASKEPIVIILNDNHMSISENVGGIEKLLQSMRLKPAYTSVKQKVRRLAENVPWLYRIIHNFKEWLKARLLQGNMFSEMGLYYLGPVDGHDISKLETAIRLARELKKPVVLHVLTVKGKGCSFAQAHPDKYHGVGAFDPETGELASSGTSFSDKLGEFLCMYAEKDERIVAITAAMASGTGTECFANRFPNRFFDIGIAEGHGCSMAAGMAKQGLIPVFAVYSSFLQRGFDMLIHDVALLGLHTVFCVDRAGLVGNDGETHHGVFDISYLSAVPGMTILCPASYNELHDMLRHAIYDTSGPVAVRYPRGGEGRYTESILSPEAIIQSGSEITIVCYGTMINEVLNAADELLEHGISAEIIKLGNVAPNSFDVCVASVRKTGRLLVPEEVCSAGCIGKAILTAISVAGVELRSAELLNLGSGIVHHGTRSQLLHDMHIDATSIASATAEMCRGDRFKA